MTDMATNRADPADRGGQENRVNCFDDPDARPSSQPCDPLILPVFLPASPGVPDAPDVCEVPARFGWLLQFQVVTLVVAAILCGLATVALLALSWSLFGLSAIVAPSGLVIPLIAAAVASAA